MANHTRFIDNVGRRKRKGPASFSAVDLLNIQPASTPRVLYCVRGFVLEAERVGDTIAFIPEYGESASFTFSPDTHLCGDLSEPVIWWKRLLAWCNGNKLGANLENLWIDFLES